MLPLTEALNETPIGIALIDLVGKLRDVNQRLCDMLGYSREELLGRKLIEVNHPSIWDQVIAEGIWIGEVWRHRKSGERYLSLSTITAIKDEHGNTTHYVGTQIDVTKRQTIDVEDADSVKRMAFFDKLTGLPNRRLLIDRLREELTNNARTGQDGALMLIDLHKFKVLNDNLGQEIGDLLLAQVGARISSCVSDTDTVARFSGDKFMVMLVDLSDNREEASVKAEGVGAKIIAKLSEPFDLNGHLFHTTSNIGVALMSDLEDNITALLKRADVAMYQAKEAGHNTLRFFDAEIQAAVIAHVSLDVEFREALVRNEFVLYFQPQVHRTYQVVAAEALVRWQHPHRGLLSPDHFISLAEETGLIMQLGSLVLRMACDQLVLWSRSPITADIQMAVNVSAAQFRQTDYVAHVLAIIEETGVDPSKLMLEVTESLLLDDVDNIVMKMKQLQSHGIQFSLDDFGVGYSSLSYLKHLPVNQLKIDKSFVTDALNDSNDASIIVAIIAFGRSLGLSVLAEGVETEQQREFLAKNDCDIFQGSLFCQPLPSHEFELFLESLAN